MSNENALNWKVLYVVEYYNFGLGCIFVWGHLENFKNKSKLQGLKT